MPKKSLPEDPPLLPRVNRRGFLKWSAILGGSAITSPAFSKNHNLIDKERKTSTLSRTEKIVRTGCPSHNCGGRCLLKVHVNDGVITRIEGDDRPLDKIADPQLRPCTRGRGYRHRQYHPDRLKYPMKRIGKRGEGNFQRISWDEALEKIASEMIRIKEKYGNSAIYVPYGTGSYNQVNGRQTAQRLMNLFGGSLGFYNSYSWACISQATPYVYGTNITGNQRQDWLNTRYILMWSWNPAEMRDGTNSDFFIRKAREKGAKIVCIDPRMTMSAVSLADEWILSGLEQMSL